VDQLQALVCIFACAKLHLGDFLWVIQHTFWLPGHVHDISGQPQAPTACVKRQPRELTCMYVFLQINSHQQHTPRNSCLHRSALDCMAGTLRSCSPSSRPALVRPGLQAHAPRQRVGPDMSVSGEPISFPLQVSDKLKRLIKMAAVDFVSAQRARRTRHTHR
jgi:hypothetical protein